MGNINIKIKIKRLWIGFIFITECVTVCTHRRMRNNHQKHPLNVHSSETVGDGCRLYRYCCCRWCFDFSWFGQSMHCTQFILPYICHRSPSLTLNLIFYPSPLHSHLTFQCCVSIDVMWIDDDAEGIAQCACFGYKSEVVSDVYIAFAPALVKWEYRCVKKTN